MFLPPFSRFFQSLFMTLQKKTRYGVLPGTTFDLKQCTESLTTPVRPKKKKLSCLFLSCYQKTEMSQRFLEITDENGVVSWGGASTDGERSEHRGPR